LSWCEASLACVPGDVVHLYHGSRQNRQYVERYQIFHDHAYDPARDVEIDPKTGLLQWSKPRGSESRIWLGVWLSILSGDVRMNDTRGLWIVTLGLPV
jgi:hypothetical protein